MLDGADHDMDGRGRAEDGARRVEDGAALRWTPPAARTIGSAETWTAPIARRTEPFVGGQRRSPEDSTARRTADSVAPASAPLRSPVTAIAPDYAVVRATIIVAALAVT